MAEPLSSLSPSSLNRNVLTNGDLNAKFHSPSKRVSRGDDHENRSPSSPWAEDRTPGEDQTFQKTPSPSKTRSPRKEVRDHFSHPLTEEALRENEGLSMHIDPAIRSTGSDRRRPTDDDAQSIVTGGGAGYAGMDDTCFSTFSAVPNVDMTRFANLTRSPGKQEQRSPTKRAYEGGISSRPASRNTPSRSERRYDDDYSSPTPRRQKPALDPGNDTTNLLVDFTDQFTAYPYPSRKSPSRRDNQSPKKPTTQPDFSYKPDRSRTLSPSKYPLPLGTPKESRHLANLLDFDLPPAPTPRSVPSISARELESMKSEFLSQISSLSASLRGKEAEVQSLKDAVTDAERRVGEAQEQIRDEKGAREALEGEKADWEKRQGEMQKVMKDVKEEIIRGDREKDSLLQRVQEAEHKREEAETRIVEAESELEGLRASAVSTSTPQNRTDGSNPPNNEVEVAVTKVAKELHGLYKSKHEAKVTALKKSYSDRWERKVRDLNTKVDELSKENDDLRLGRDATMTRVVPPTSNTDTTASISTLSIAGKNAETEAQVKDLETKLSTMESELSTIRTTLEGSESGKRMLQDQLEASRAETADLIAASEELMLLSQPSFSSSVTGGRPPSVEPPIYQGENLRRQSFSRSTSGSGLKAPGFGTGSGSGGGGESRIGRVGMGAGTGGIERSGSGLGRSGILSNIERMGRGREKD